MINNLTYIAQFYITPQHGYGGGGEGALQYKDVILPERNSYY